jgi:hypothetical protein
LTTFALDISKFNEKVMRHGNIAVRKICLELTTAIIIKTPRKTGRAQSNWFASIGSPVAFTTNVLEGSALSVVARESKMAENAFGNIYWLSNNLPYIERLEYGYSKQAPAGMARLSIEEVKRHYTP